ncbi:pteridine reductase [Oceanicoccus sagamiensis]|uniref:Pteridine reductase n=1 Tax=Oceanicoccus sagamiensis TaxID=716816 RepID=A0A1X9NH84_9GAMM|nr:pteridine reductase [Oceanicoccus sagamiensis]ARN74297.1 pteridine reductase [Oceanicoccus sagamiensis]
MSEQTTQRVALVTGAAQRIGAEICKTLHGAGFNIIIHYRSSSQPAEELADQLNQQRSGSAHCIKADLTNSNDVLALAIAAEKHWGHIDALINNASTFYPTPLNTSTEEDWNALFDSNVKGPFFLSQTLTPTLSQRQGCIVNLVDIHSEKPMADHTIYSMAKASVAMMTKTLAKEMAPAVRVNGVSPGAILWPEQELDPNDKSSILNKVPMQKIGDVSDIAKTVAFLVNDAPYITGQIIAVDGGRSLNM